MIKKIISFIPFILGLILLSSLCFAQNPGSIDYINNVVIATGIGAPNPDLPEATARPAALRVAKADALRNLLETVKGVRINSETTVENFMLSSDVIYTQVEGVIRNFKIVDTRYMSDGTVEIDVEMPLSGDFADLVLPQEVGGGDVIKEKILRCPVCGQPWPEGVPFPEEYKDQLEDQPIQGKQYTGLIVDASGLDIQPAMAPKIFNEDGKEVYGTGFVNRDYAVKMGIIGYSKNIEQAKEDSRVTDDPFVIKGLEAKGPNQTDIVISNNNAAILHSMKENLSFLEKCRVIVTID